MNKIKFSLKSLLVASTVLLSQAVFAEPVELVKNGTFDGGNDVVALTWTGYNKARVNDVKEVGDGAITFYDNAHGGGGGGGAISQAIDTVPGQFYLLTYEQVRDNMYWNQNQKGLAVALDKGQLFGPTDNYREWGPHAEYSARRSYPINHVHWTTAYFVIKAASEKTTFWIQDNSGDGANSRLHIDNVSVHPYDFDSDGWCDIELQEAFEENADFTGGCERFNDTIDTKPKVPNAPNADSDNDGLTDDQEAVLGTDPNKADSDNDGINDKVEVGDDLTKPLDEDKDGVIDAIESANADKDNDGTVDQKDPADADRCIPQVQPTGCGGVVPVVDTDGDTMPDAQEVLLGTDPNKKDTDGDGTIDPEEIGDFNDPRDTDKDGELDAIESSILDADKDGVADQFDIMNDDPCVPNKASAPCTANADTDGDTLTDIIENQLGTNPALVDTDGDGLADNIEVGVDVANPLNADGDALIDALESNVTDADKDGFAAQFDADENDPCVPNKSVSACTSLTDTDGDSIPDVIEKELGTNPESADSDNDGLNDAAEVGNDFENPHDFDLDGVIDALDSNIKDSDGDKVVDQNDRANADPCVPNKDATVCVGAPVDSDNDGLTDEEEALIGTNPNAADTDGDGESDKEEVGSNLSKPLDQDGDGIIDALESDKLDSDGDKIVDEKDPTNTPKPGVDLTPIFTLIGGLLTQCIPVVGPSVQGWLDCDKDGLSNSVEANKGTDPWKKDTDGDGLTDGEEVNAKDDASTQAKPNGVSDPLNANDPCKTDCEKPDVDTDGDGLSDKVEAELGTDPEKRDTDGDKLSDADEVNDYKTDPIKADTDNDGLTDGEEVTGQDDASTTAKPDGKSDPLDSNDPCRVNCSVDTDGDGLTDAQEEELGTDHTDKDSDDDGLTDAEEVTGEDDASTTAKPVGETNPLDGNSPCREDCTSNTGGGLNVFGGANPAWMMIVMFGLLITRKRK